MQLEYVSNGKPFKVNEALGKVLVARKLARFPVEQPTGSVSVQTRAIKAEDDAEISERTGQPKRTYRRRDLKAES